MLTRLKIDENTVYEKSCDQIWVNIADSIHEFLYYKIFRPLSISVWETTNQEMHNQLIDEVDKTARRLI